MANDNKTKHPNWGGKRAGAGAPRGNLNGLKHGRYSRQQALIVQALADIPEARDALINIAKRNRIRRKQAEEAGGIMLITLLENAAAFALSPSEPATGHSAPGTGHSELSTEDNQRSNHGRTNQDFLTFLNAATAEIRRILEKPSRKRRIPIK
jgi:hypothetical protein